MEKISASQVHCIVTHMSSDENKGDYAILSSTIGLLKRCDCTLRITCVSSELMPREITKTEHIWLTRELGVDIRGTLVPRFGRKPTTALVGIALLVLQELILRLTWRWPSLLRVLRGETRRYYDTLSDSEYIIAKGGSYLYGHRGVKDLVFLWRMLFPMRVAVALHKPLYVLGVSLGPFESHLSRRMTRSVLSRATKIWLREDISVKEALETLALSPMKVDRSPDIALALEASDLPRPIAGRVAVTVRRLPYSERMPVETARAQYENALVGALDRLLDANRIGEIRYCPQTREDLPLAKKLASRSMHPEKVTVIDSEPELDDLLRIYAGSQMVIGARLHSIILAAVAGTPGIHLWCERSKGFGVMETLGMSDYVLDAEGLNESELCDVVERALADEQNLRRRLAATVGRSRAEAETIVRELVRDAASRTGADTAERERQYG